MQPEKSSAARAHTRLSPYLFRLLKCSVIGLALAFGFATPARGEDDSIALRGGDVLRGTIVAETETAVTLDHPALGRIEVSRASIASINRTAVTIPTAPPTPTPEASAEGSKPVAAVPTAVLPAPVPPPPPRPDGSWKFHVDFAGSGSQNGEGSNWDIRFAGEAKRESETDRTNVTAEYYFNSANSVTTDDNLLVRGLEEFLFAQSKWEAFVQGNYQWDNFQAWESRAGMYAGPGYRLLEGEPISLRLRGGAGASYEFPTSTWTAELLFANQLEWVINAQSKLTQAFEFYPDVENLDEYRYILRLEYAVKLSEKGDITGVAGVRDEFDSFVGPGEGTSNDFKIYAGIGLDF